MLLPTFAFYVPAHLGNGEILYGTLMYPIPFDIVTKFSKVTPDWKARVSMGPVMLSNPQVQFQHSQLLCLTLRMIKQIDLHRLLSLNLFAVTIHSW